MLGVGLVLLLISALVSGSEVAFFSLTPSDQQQMRSSGDKRDEAILALRSDVDALLATILVTNNLQYLHRNPYFERYGLTVCLCAFRVPFQDGAGDVLAVALW